MKEQQFAEYINLKNSSELRREMNALQKDLDAMNRRGDGLSALSKRLYIGERSVKYSRSATQSIRIIYRDIGVVGSAMGPDEKQVHIAPPIMDDNSKNSGVFFFS